MQTTQTYKEKQPAQEVPAKSNTGLLALWPDLSFPPINLWSAPRREPPTDLEEVC